MVPWTFGSGATEGHKYARQLRPRALPETPSKLQRDAARNIVTKYLEVRAGENAIIESWNHTMPMASAMVDEVRRRGGKVLQVYSDEDSSWRTIDRKQSKLLGKSSDPEWAALKAADVYVNFWGPGDTDRLEKLPDKPGNDAFSWNWPWYAVARKAGLRGVRMTEGFVTEGRAKKWGVDRAEWEESVLRACLIDPEETARSGARLARSLSRGKRVRITHSNRTDMEVALAGVASRLTDGRPHPYHRGTPRRGCCTKCPPGLSTWPSTQRPRRGPSGPIAGPIFGGPCTPADRSNSPTAGSPRIPSRREGKSLPASTVRAPLARTDPAFSSSG